MTLASEGAARMTVRTSNKKVPTAAVVRYARAAVVPGDAMSYTTVAPWNSSTLPRTIRKRSWTSPRKGPKPGRTTPPSPGSPQAAVQNAVTGRFALGPWAGPFAAAPSATKPASEPSLPETLYMDGTGLVHYGLSQAAHDAVLRTVRSLQDAEASSTQTEQLNMMLAAEASDRAAALRGARLADAMQHPKKERLYASARGHAAVKRMHLINQPRACNY